MAMKTVKIALAALACMCLMSSAGAEEAEKEIALQNPMDCSNMGADLQQFASQLNATNKKMFCGQFNAAQRSTAMQYATQKDSTGAMMSPDKAVQQVATENNMKPSSKTPTGCPVK
jgi:Tfp pilus assembly protein PilP